MWPYWLMFIAVAWVAMTRMRAPTSGVSLINARWRLSWWIPLVALTLMIGLRHDVGGDWFVYLNHIQDARGETFLNSLGQGDPAYVALNWFGANVFGGEYLVNTVCAALFAWGLLSFCRAQPRPWLAFLVAVPYLITVVAMGYTRQGVAIGLAMLGLTAVMKGSVLRFVLWVAIAATFHKSALILLPLGIFSSGKHRFVTLIGVIGSAGLLFILLLQEHVDTLLANYIEAEYSASGAAIRIFMNALPASIFLLFRQHFRLSPSQRSFWTWISLVALVFVVLFIVSPSSTAVDRIALYWIPLQLFVWSRTPDIFGQYGQRNLIWAIAVAAYSGGVLFTWLFFADHAYAWLPYQWYPWVYLWS